MLKKSLNDYLTFGGLSNNLVLVMDKTIARKPRKQRVKLVLVAWVFVKMQVGILGSEQIAKIWEINFRQFFVVLIF